MNWSLSLRVRKTCNLWTRWNFLAASGIPLSSSASSIMEASRTLPTSNRASATTSGRYLWYNKSNLCALSRRRAIRTKLGTRRGTNDLEGCAFCWENPRMTWNSGTLFLTSFSTSLLRLPQSPTPVSLTSNAISTCSKLSSTAAYFWRHFVKESAVQCCTRPEEDKSPFVKIFLGDTWEGSILERMVWSGGGVGSYRFVLGR